MHETLFYTLMQLKWPNAVTPQEHLITLHATEEFKRETYGYIATERNVLVGLQRRWSTSSGCCLILAERESRICTSIYSSGLFPISSSKLTWNMHDGEPTTCTKFINLHKKSRQSWRQQICRKALFTSIQSDPHQKREWLGCVGTNKSDEINSESQIYVE